MTMRNFCDGNCSTDRFFTFSLTPPSALWKVVAPLAPVSSAAFMIIYAES